MCSWQWIGKNGLVLLQSHSRPVRYIQLEELTLYWNPEMKLRPSWLLLGQLDFNVSVSTGRVMEMCRWVYAYHDQIAKISLLMHVACATVTTVWAFDGPEHSSWKNTMLCHTCSIARQITTYAQHILPRAHLLYTNFFDTLYFLLFSTLRQTSCSSSKHDSLNI